MNKIYKSSSILAMCLITSFAQAVQLEENDFPELKESYLKQSPIFDLEHLSLLKLNQDKDVVRAIIGNPHFKEGMFSKTWNYKFDVKITPNEYRQCQLRIDFDKQNISNNLQWKGENCGDSWGTKTNLEKDKIVLDEYYESFFTFPLNQSDIFLAKGNDLSIQDLMQKLKSNNNKIKIEGYADQQGKFEYNEKISLERAKSMADFLLKNGIDYNRISIVAFGSTSKFEQCIPPNFEKYANNLNECWEKNRRVNVIW